MEAFGFPPFELGKYRIIYLEQTESIVKCTVELDKSGHGDSAEMAAAYEFYKAEVAELVLRLILLEEAYGRTDLALPDSFLINHHCYILNVATLPWTTPQRFRFFRKHDLSSSGPSLASQSSPVSDHDRLVCWPFKYRFTFRPRGHKLDGSSQPLSNMLQDHRNEHALLMDYQVGDQEGNTPRAERISVGSDGDQSHEYVAQGECSDEDGTLARSA